MKAKYGTFYLNKDQKRYLVMLPEKNKVSFDPDSAVSSSLKVTLPENVFNELSTYSEANSFSKSDVIREAIKEKIGRDNSWINRLFLFPKQTKNAQDDIANIIESLKIAKKGALIKIAANKDDMPSVASALICYLVKYDDQHVYVEIPSQYPATFLNKDVQDISMCSGTLSVPKEIRAPDLYPFLSGTFIHTVPLSHIWGIDCKIEPQVVPSTHGLPWQ